MPDNPGGSAVKLESYTLERIVLPDAEAAAAALVSPAAPLPPVAPSLFHV